MARAENEMAGRNGNTMRMSRVVSSTSTLPAPEISSLASNGAARKAASMSAPLATASNASSAPDIRRCSAGARLLYTGMNELVSAPSASSSLNRLGTLKAVTNASMTVVGKNCASSELRTSPETRLASVPTISVSAPRRVERAGLLTSAIMARCHQRGLSLR